MRNYEERRKQIGDLLRLIDKLELEPKESVQMETNLLIAYSLLEIERHLAAAHTPEQAGAPR